MWHLFRSLMGVTRKEPSRASKKEMPVVGMPAKRVSTALEDFELSDLSFTPELAAEDFFTQNQKQLVKGDFQPVLPIDNRTRDVETPKSMVAILAAEPIKGQKLALDVELDQETRAFINNGPLPSMAVRSDQAAALKAKIGGDAVTLSLQNTLKTAALARNLGFPIIVAGKGLLEEFSSLTANEYVISTLGSRSADGNIVHAMVISPVLLVEDILSTNIGRVWLANLIRKEQLLVSYRPIRAASSCEDLAERAKAMPTDAMTIIWKQRGLDAYS